jgi:hypothetical protein
MIKKTISIFITLCAVLTFTSCLTVTQEKAAPLHQSIYPGNSYVSYIHSINVVLEDISQEDFSVIKQNAKELCKKAEYGYPNYTKNNMVVQAVNFRKRNQLSSQGIYGYYSYNAEEATGYIYFRVGIYGSRKENSRNLDSLLFTPDDLQFLKQIIDFEKNPFKGYYFGYSFNGNNRSISGNADGNIVININLDSSSAITVGGYLAMTDMNGDFSFSGSSSLARITEGIIVLTDTSGNEVLAMQDKETKEWYVEVVGQKGAKEHKFNLVIDSLNL